MDAMVEIRAIFFEECAENLGALGDALASLRSAEPDAEAIGTAYRAVHSIKGGAASFRLGELTRLALEFETLLGAVRDGTLRFDEAIGDLSARSAHALARQIEASRLAAPLHEEIAGLTGGVPPAGEPVSQETPDASDLGFVPVAVDPSAILGTLAPSRLSIRFAPHASLYACANEATVLIREVLALGTGRVECLYEGPPDLRDLDPEGAALAFRITLDTIHGEDDVREIFSFVEEDCVLDIERVREGESEDLIARLLAEARA